MSDSSSGSEKEKAVEVVYVQEDFSSGEDPPMSEWSSLITELPEDNPKRLLYSQGLYAPGSGEICNKYIAVSDSSILRHVYYNYPAVDDPGIKEALLHADQPVIYNDDGQDLYLAICKKMNTHPIRMFHKGLLNDKISLSYYGVNPQAVRAMAIALQYNKYVQSLDLTDNFLNDDACYHLGRMLLSNVTLTELNVTGCRIGHSGILRLGYTLKINRTLMTLNLSNNNIGEKGGEYFAKQIFNGAVVRRIDLSKNSLGRITALALTEAFEINNKITHLDLSWNNFFQPQTTAKLLVMIASTSHVLQELNLAWNSLEGERVADALKSILLIPTLAVLNLSNNRLQGEAITKISENLNKAKKLETLDLSFNPMSPTDAQAVLEKMLKARVKIENLLMTNVWVKHPFITILQRVKRMKSRKNFKITYGGVLEDWIIAGVDARDLLLKRANFLGNLSKKHKVDVPLFFLALQKEYNIRPISVKDLLDRVVYQKVPMDEGLISELANVFPGPKSAKVKYINLESVCEYIHRIWPEKKLPPTPPPEPEPEPEPVPTKEEVQKKGGKKGKK